MDKVFYSAKDTFEFDGQGVFEGISLHSNKPFSPRKTPLILKVNGEFDRIVERGLMDPNECAVPFDLQLNKPFTLSFENVEKDERIIMKFSVEEASIFH